MASSVHAGSVMHGLLNPYRCSADLDTMPPSYSLPGVIGQPVFDLEPTLRLHL